MDFLNQKKYFVYKQVPLSGEYNEAIEKEFYDPDRFLSFNPALTVGKRARNKTEVGKKYLSENRQKGIHKSASKSGKTSTKTFIKLNKNKRSDLSLNANKGGVTECDDRELRRYFRKIEDSLRVNRFDKLIDENQFKDSLKSNLITQECNLKGVQKRIEDWNQVSERLCDKTSKAEKESLLMNKTDSYRMKKEIREMITRGQKISKYGNKTWFISLRRPQNFKGSREAFINLGHQEAPKWQLMIDQVPAKYEMVLKPNSNSYQDLRKFTKNEYLTTTMTETNIEEIENGKGDLVIKGQNLLEYEKEKAFKLKGRKIMHNIQENKPGMEELTGEKVFCAKYPLNKVSVREATTMFL